MAATRVTDAGIAPAFRRWEVDAFFVDDGAEVRVDARVLGTDWREVTLTVNDDGSDNYARMRSREHVLQTAHALLRALGDGEGGAVRKARSLLAESLPKVEDE